MITDVNTSLCKHLAQNIYRLGHFNITQGTFKISKSMDGALHFINHFENGQVYYHLPNLYVIYVFNT